MQGSRGEGAVGLTVRRHPWPYRAMLAVCSDLDGTPDERAYFEVARFLNTTEATAMGPGVGLEVGNTIYFDMPPGHYSYWATDDRGREGLRALMRSGHIDAVHSWGDLATERRHAERNLAELLRHGCRLEVWVDHSDAPSNFGPDIMRGRGDLSESPAYHADLTLAYGVRYVWRGRTTALTGQDAPVRPGSYAPILRRGHALASARTVLRETLKVALGRLGSPRWRIHGVNRVCHPCTLRDGNRAWEFLRTNPSWGGPGMSATASGIPEVLTPRMLDRLVASGGAAILYTHLGRGLDSQRLLGPGVVAAFRGLARLRDGGTILVTTTQRLLRYVTLRDHIRCRAVAAGEKTVITLEAVDDPVKGTRSPEASELAGLTLGVPSAGPVEVRLASGETLACELVARIDGTAWVRVPWPALRFPDLSGR